MNLLGRRLAVSLVLSIGSLLFASPAAAQSLELQLFTNGEAADAPPGVILTVGDAIAWTYMVTNIDSRAVTDIALSDDAGNVITCPDTELDAGLAMICTANGVALAGQNAVVATADYEDFGGTPGSVSDTSHYYGQPAASASITIEKATVGQDADTAPGPSIDVGDPVTWTYVVTNIGADPLTNVVVTDSQGEGVACPKTTLAAGESMTCTAASVAVEGQYANIGTVTAELPSTATVEAADPSHYSGVAPAVENIGFQKATNGDDADGVPGPSVAAGSTVTWTYTIDNPGPGELSGISIDDSDPLVSVSCPATTLGAGESMECSATGTAMAGQYTNTGTLDATLAGFGAINKTDDSHYFGQAIDIQKLTNGQDADAAPGPSVTVGSTVTWSYVVTNLGTDALTNIAVTDDVEGAITCPATTLAGGESMTCTHTGTAAAGGYANLGTVTADLGAESVEDSDASNYFGQAVGFYLDFGDAEDPQYPTLFASTGARHVITGGGTVYLGACVDAEVDGQPSAGGDGDDTGVGDFTLGSCAIANDDEDGVTFISPLVAGDMADVDVVANDVCTLSAFLDFNRDGDFVDAGENLFPGGQALAAGVNMLSFSVPASAQSGATAARFRCSTDGALSPNDEATDGEVEDYVVDIAGFDFGDAPDPSYATLLASDGARHAGNGSEIALGTDWDADPDGQPNAGATGDDAADTDDEDGVTFGYVIPGQNADVVVEVSGSAGNGFVDAWMDFNADGDWSDAGEQIFASEAVSNGSNALTFSVPGGATLGNTFARFRVSTSGSLAVTGLTATGEVEDYAVGIVAPAIAVTKTADPTSLPEPGGNATFTIEITEVGGIDTAIGSLTDDLFGNLDGQGTCDVPQAILAGGSYSCAFTGAVSGNSGDVVGNTVTATGTAAGLPVTGNASASVTITDVLPTISATKSADPTSLLAPGGPVEFTVSVTNTGTAEAVTLTTLSDDLFGSLDGQGTCSLPQAIATGATYTCVFTGTVNGVHFDTITNTVTATAQDDEANSANATASASVTLTNNVPVANDDTYNTQGGTELVVPAATGVLVNDTDADSDPLTATKVNDPANGTVVLAADGSFTYTPPAGFLGTDSFTYMVNDGTDDSTAATVTIQVINNAPVAVKDTYDAPGSTPLQVPAATGVLANDTDADGDPLTAVKQTDPAHGTVALAADGSFTYTPTSGYVGPDTFTYKANDGKTDSAAATVKIQVDNNAPVANDDAYVTNAGVALAIASPGVRANDTDADGDDLTVMQVTGPAHGSLDLESNGAFTYTPTPAFAGVDSFTYKVNDGTEDSNVATAQITVACTLAISPTSRGHGAAADDGAIDVSTQPGCAWTAFETAAWVSITAGAAGSGPGQVVYAIEESDLATGRSATILVSLTGGTSIAFTIGQSSAGADFGLTPESVVFPGDGGTGLALISAGPGVSWTAASTVPWIDVTASGTGSGEFTYAVEPNPGDAPRVGTILVGGLSLTVEQAPDGSSSIIIWIGEAPLETNRPPDLGDTTEPGGWR